MTKKKHKHIHHDHQSINLSARAKSRLAKQKQRQGIIKWASIGLVGALALFLSVGIISQWLIPVYLPMQETVITVNGKEFNARYVSRMVNYYTGGDPTYAYLFIDPIMDQIVNNELMKQAAADLGINISDDDVKALLDSSELDNNPTTRDIIYASLLVQKLKDGKFATEVGVSGEQRQTLAMLLESAAQAEAVKARLEAGEAFADIVTALSLDSTTITNKGDMSFHPEGILNGLLNAKGLEEAVFAAGAGEIGFLFDDAKSKQLGYWVLKLTEKKTENEVTTAKVLGILVPTSEKAEEVRAKLVAGGDFAALAAEYSQDSTTNETGGELTTLTLGTSTGPAAIYAFGEETVLNEISQPILTKDSNTNGAYWLYKVAAVEASRTFADADKTKLVDAAFSEWLTGVTEDASGVDRVELTEDMRDVIAEQSMD